MANWWERFNKEVATVFMARFADFMQKLYERLAVLGEEQIDDLFLFLDDTLEHFDEDN